MMKKINKASIAIMVISIIAVTLAVIMIYSYLQNQKISTATQLVITQKSEQIATLQVELTTLQAELAAKQKSLDEALAKIDSLQKEIESLKALVAKSQATSKPTSSNSVSSKPAATKPGTPASKPATEKPKPSTPAPTYTHKGLNITWVCDGKGDNPDRLPPTDGDCWFFDCFNREWEWDESKGDLSGIGKVDPPIDWDKEVPHITN